MGLYLMCPCVYEGLYVVHAHATVHMLSLEDELQEFLLSFYNAGQADQIWLSSSFGDIHLCQLTYLVSPHRVHS